MRGRPQSARPPRYADPCDITAGLDARVSSRYSTAVSPPPNDDRPGKPARRLMSAWVYFRGVYFKRSSRPGGSSGGVREPLDPPPDAGSGSAQVKPPTF